MKKHTQKELMESFLPDTDEGFNFVDFCVALGAFLIILWIIL